MRRTLGRGVVLILTIFLYVHIAPPGATQGQPAKIRVVSQYTGVGAAAIRGKLLLDLHPRDQVQTGDKIQNAKTPLALRIFQMVTTHLLPDTVIHLTGPFETDANGVAQRDGVITVLKGGLLVRLAQKVFGQSRLIINTRSATCAAKGTRFAVLTTDTETTLVVEHGTVTLESVANPGNPITVLPGQVAKVGAGPPENPVRIDSKTNPEMWGILEQLRDLPSPSDGVIPFEQAGGVKSAAYEPNVKWASRPGSHDKGIIGLLREPNETERNAEKGNEPKIEIVHAVTGARIETLDGQEQPVTVFVMNASGDKVNVTTGAVDGRIRQWQLQDPWRAWRAKVKEPQALEVAALEPVCSILDDDQDLIPHFNRTDVFGPYSTPVSPISALYVPDRIQAWADQRGMAMAWLSPNPVSCRHTAAVTSVMAWGTPPTSAQVLAGLADGRLVVWGHKPARSSNLYFQNPVAVGAHKGGAVTYTGKFGELYVTGGVDGHVRFWNLKESTPDLHDPRVMDIFPQGVTEKQLKAARVFEPELVLDVLVSEGAPIMSVKFDRSLMLATTADGTILTRQMTGLNAGKVTTVRAHASAIFAAGFSSDGMRVMTVGADGIGTWWLGD